MKIINADSQQTCEHYNMQKLFNFSFPSISEGCVCKNGDIKMSLCNQTFKGSKPCSPQGDGENVYKQEGFQVENWGLRINTNQTQNNNYTSQSDNDQNTKLLSFQICGLYNTEYNYLNSFNVKFDESNSLHSQEMINNSNSCQYINKEYDLFNLSSFNNLTYQNCPITSFKIIDIRSTQYQQGQNTYYLDIPQSDYMKFQVKRDPNAYPLSQISVQWGKGICLNSNWPEPINNKYAYKLYNIQVNDCQLDNNFYPILNSQIGQKDLIINNHQESFIQKLPNLFNDNINQFSIFARQFPKMNCNQRMKAIIVYKFILSVVNIGIQIGVIYYINDNMINIIDSLCDQQCVDQITYDLLKKNAQLDRDIAHVLQQTALNHAPRNEHARISSLLAINQNINNPNSIFQIRMDEDQDISEKGNTTKDTQSIKRNIDFY
ncbi:transmembrane protein, putative (macronuclear) [Tetrahymena thermophila SB210]|uniref:Transmembrane protein, putative n=1 Tax=Tetrahymena thermophila (strain SB210) TaxID=312017 RepID=I7M3A7_TETTS|nr:transmembrane protein, putative [Tetrahymena thermophila SB210]EAS02784.2 transmembrane protein, putative [Tetrahymena thermophila SB210]|eukprot:XP_001023029.2 transmembrane protein, putative [Tetrahymena thermophila SB210]